MEEYLLYFLTMLLNYPLVTLLLYLNTAIIEA